MAWSDPTTPDEAHRRASGRRAYNARRAFVRTYRWRRVVELLATYRLSERGTVTAIARALGVHPGTISRDLKGIRDLTTTCPRCGSVVPREWLNAAAPK